MEKLVVVSKVYDGKLSGYASETLREFISSNNGKNLEIVVKRKRAKRSNAQNKFYWGAVIPIIQAAFKDLGTRLNPEEVHFFLKQKFNYKTLVSVDGELIGEIPQSTAELNKLEFMEYIDKITQWSAEILNIQIPEPKHYDL